MITKEELHPDDQVNWPGFASYICGKWEIARRYRPKRILEIGVRAGYAAWAFLQVHPDADYTGYDNYSYGEYPEWAMENLLKDYDVSINRIDTQEIGSIDGEFDFIHVDGDHTVNGVIHDMDLAINSLSENGVILIDDYDRIADVKTGVDRWLANHPDLDWKYCESFTGDILIGKVNYCLPENSIEQEDKGKLLLFHHGLGDLLLFLPLYEYLKELGNYQLALQEGCGFTPLVDGAIETPAGDFDYDTFCREEGYSSYQVVDFDMSEGSGKTKTLYCAGKEFNICDISFDPYKYTKSVKVVGVHFNGTCLPESTNPDESVAKGIWNEIAEAGFTPFEVNFEHVFHNPKNSKFDFIEGNSTRGITADIRLLMAVLKGCDAFIGVASGVFVTATTLLESKNVCYLQKQHSLEDYFEKPKNIAIDINNYKPGSVKKWLDSLL